MAEHTKYDNSELSQDEERDPIGQEIKVWIKENYKSAVEFSEKSGIAYSTLQNWFSGKRSPTYLAIKKLIGFGFVPDLGEITKPLQDAIQTFNKDQNVDALEQGLNKSNAQMKQLYTSPLDEKNKENWFRFVPLLDVAASAGNGQPVYSEHLEDEYAFNKQWLTKKGLLNATLSVIHITGNSMADKINHGDCILVHHEAPPIDGKISLIKHEDELYVKRMELSRSGWIAKSDNPQYDPIEMNENSEIVGRAVCMMADL